MISRNFCKDARNFFALCRSSVNQNYLRKSLLRRTYKELISSSPVRLSYARIEGKDTDPDSHPPSLIICHGLFGAKKNWRSIGKTLNAQSGREVISIDARNHGSSEHHDEMNYFVQALDVRNLLEELNVPKAVMIGHSMGGKVAMTFALCFPELVDKVIVIDSSPVPSISDEDIQRYLNTKIHMDLSKIRNKKDAENMMESTVPSVLMRQFFLANLKPTPSGGFRWRINLDAIDKNLQDLMAFPSHFPHPNFTGQTLFIGGGNSNYIQKKDYGLIYTLFPKAEITYIPDCGHWVHAEKPHELMELILDFLQRYP